MKPLRILIAVVILLCVSTSALSSTPLSETVLKHKAEEFIRAKNARQQPNTSIEDVEKFISLFSDNFIDEHIKFNVTVTKKSELRKGMVAKLEDKVYFCEVKIDQLMFGRNVAFIKYTEHAKVKPSHMSKAVEYTSTNIVSLEFDDNGLIKHLRRHHG
ncbi:hypothetical protein M0G74_16140 [Microbulbifer sp. CAU 1566]|uniref:hypothetical protein n=1 Tax=Microbulbifer sp. CAU 1566 TaxID=2933269 RepID=UPI0020061F16|nr:hypothetical protein [Microbulbifer sp. CAU 1566]MCK7598805.1 hypothetical protein [Microbulbifer sp. CAU 1566]